MKFKDDFGSNSSSSGKDFIKIQDGKSVVGLCAGDPYEFFQHWVGKKSEECIGEMCKLCRDGSPKERFRINFIVKEANGYVAKIFEQGPTVYGLLRTISKRYPLNETLIEICRSGSGLNDTSYSILPMDKSLVTPEKLELIKKVKLHDLTLKEQKETVPSIDNDETIPF